MDELIDVTDMSLDQLALIGISVAADEPKICAFGSNV